MPEQIKMRDFLQLNEMKNMLCNICTRVLITKSTRYKYLFK